MYVWITWIGIILKSCSQWHKKSSSMVIAARNSETTRSWAQQVALNAGYLHQIFFNCWKKRTAIQITPLIIETLASFPLNGKIWF